MNCHVKVELLNPADGSVVKSVEADGVVTNAHKYLSTCGYPFIARSKRVTLASMCLDLTAGGCIAFENAQSTDENDYKFDLSDKKVAWGTRYSEDYSAFSSKYGALNKDLSTFDRKSFTKVWDWSESQGNGKINSVCLTHAAGAGAVDNIPPPDTTAVYTMGNDGAPVISCPTGNSALGTAAFQANTDPMHSYEIRPSDASGVRPDVFYYQTDNSIICLNTKGLNVVTTDSTGKNVFRHTFRYRRIDKKWMYKWEGGVLLSAREKNYCQHLLSYPIPLTDEAGNETYLDGDWDGDLTFDTTSEVKTMFAGRYNSITGDDRTRVYLEDSFGIALFSKGIDYYIDDDGNKVDVGFADKSDVSLTKSNSNALVTYIITGETPYVKVFESHYRCALSQSSFHTNGYIRKGIIILKDFSYIYKSYRGTSTSDANYNYIARRMLSEDTLVWKVDLGNAISTALPLKRFYWDSDYFCLPYVNNSSQSQYYSGGVYYTVRKNSDGSVVGYFLDNIEDRVTTNLMPKDDNLFILDSAGYNAVYGFISYLNTNYMWLKANLPTEVVKTAAYKMRITVKVNY